MVSDDELRFMRCFSEETSAEVEDQTVYTVYDTGVSVPQHSM